MLWLCTMAWRDSRGSRRRLLLALTASGIGLAACIAITAFDANVRLAMQAQAKTLLGADLVLRSRQPLTQEAEAFLATLGGDQTREISCASMAYFPKNGLSRLVQLRALDGPFPYYGRLETEPPGAVHAMQTGQQAVVDHTLLLQVEAQLGDTIRLGSLSLPIHGRLTKIPGESFAATVFSPRVYVSLATLQQAGLLQKGSMVTYKVYIKLPAGVDADALLETRRADLSTHSLHGDTVRKHTASLGRLSTNLSHFLNLIGFVAVLLGGVGVASSMHVYITGKLTSVAVLRCLGVRPRQALAIYLLQALALGCLAALLGGVGGLAIQASIPRLVRDFLPFTLPSVIAWAAVFRALALGVGLVLAFALLPLGAIRRVAPLAALRAVSTACPAAPRDPWRWGVCLLLAGLIGGFAYLHTERWSYGLGFCLGLALVLLCLAGVARLLMWLLRNAFPSTWPYVWRQGFLNLFRPNNQTLLMIVALGLGTFLLLTLYLVQRALLQQAWRSDATPQPNVIVFDIQYDQRDAVATLIQGHGLPILQQVPLVNMRLASINGKGVRELHATPEYRRASWALLWEYRATYRAHLLDTERLLAGNWQGHVDTPEASVPISLEGEIARTLQVGLGDRLEFDVQGVTLATTVASLRRVEWQRLQPNVYVLFPSGVLEAAPQFLVLLTRAATPARIAAVQRDLVQHFPNISVIDLTMLVQTIADMVQQIAFVIRFMAFFSIAAGVLVLLSAVSMSRAQRLRESVLLRILGASRRQLWQIVLLEYLMLGGFAALSALVLAHIASWALLTWLFESPFDLAAGAMLSAFVLVLLLSAATGLAGSRGVTTRPPLDILRSAG